MGLIPIAPLLLGQAPIRFPDFFIRICVGFLRGIESNWGVAVVTPFGKRQPRLGAVLRGIGIALDMDVEPVPRVDKAVGLWVSVIVLGGFVLRPLLFGRVFTHGPRLSSAR
ncbi:hypothetical protein A5652_06975 [Mycobacterium sp. 1165178.9]|nr:hypothetical protein A5652_06975 [Mycobacterium sp. 1165178.9]